jgi:hypothetical protein
MTITEAKIEAGIVRPYKVDVKTYTRKPAGTEEEQLLGKVVEFVAFSTENRKTLKPLAKLQVELLRLRDVVEVKLTEKEYDAFIQIEGTLHGLLDALKKKLEPARYGQPEATVKAALEPKEARAKK